ncbi:MAG: hypothetical protein PHI71_18165 [Acidiphilium sp.]|nr:hypothetical protein [Acidiphilium sp.]
MEVDLFHELAVPAHLGRSEAQVLAGPFKPTFMTRQDIKSHRRNPHRIALRAECAAPSRTTLRDSGFNL